MIRLILRWLNAPALVLMLIIAIGIQTSVFAYYPLIYLQPDIILIAVIWCALHRKFTEGGVLTLLFGNIAEIHSASPSGLLMITYMAVYLLVRSASRFFVIPNFSYVIILTLGASIFWKACTLIILTMMGMGENQWKHTLVLLLPGAVMTGITAIWVFRGLEWFDWKTFKNERAQQMLEDEIQLEGEMI